MLVEIVERASSQYNMALPPPQQVTGCEYLGWRSRALGALFTRWAANLPFVQYSGMFERQKSRGLCHLPQLTPMRPTYSDKTYVRVDIYILRARTLP